MNLTDLVFSKPLTPLERTIAEIKLIRKLQNESGPNTPFLYKITEIVNDNFHYTEPVKVMIAGQYSQNGWNFYTVKNKNRFYNLREKDISPIL